MRLLIETLSIVAGLIVVVVIASLSAWAYPRGEADIWHVAYVCMAVTVLLGAASARRAFLKDREKLRGNGPTSDE